MSTSLIDSILNLYSLVSRVIGTSKSSGINGILDCAFKLVEIKKIKLLRNKKHNKRISLHSD
jgi:hypothetical protein